MAAMVSSAIPRPQITNSRNLSRCRSIRLSSTVLISASPTAPPRLRVRLKRPDAFFIFCGGIVPSARLLIGTMHSINEKPRNIWGTSSSQKSQSDVMFEASHVPTEKPTNPTAIIRRGSSTVDNRPEIGAITNMQTPVTNIVSPIISGE